MSTLLAPPRPAAERWAEPQAPRRGPPVPRRVLGLASTWLLPAEAALANAVAALPWRRGFAVPGATWLLVGAAVAAVVPAVLVARVWRRPPAASYAVSAAALVLVAVLGTGSGPSALWSALTRGPTQLLTETLPLSGPRALLAAPLVVVWLAGTVASELLCRTERSGPALAAPVLAYLAAYATTAGAPGRAELTGPLLLATLALVALSRRWLADSGARASPARAAGAAAAGTAWTAPATGAAADAAVEEARRWSRRSARRALAGALVAAAVTIASALLVPYLPPMRATPASPRRRPPTLRGLVVDPVDAVAALRDDDPGAPATRLLRVTIDAPTPGYLPVAYLDRYDGNAWSFDDTFLPTGGRVPAAPVGAIGTDQALDTSVVRARVTVLRSYGIPFVPIVGRPSSFHGLAVDVSERSGMAVPAGDLGAGVSYEVTGRAPNVTIESLPASDGLELDGPGAAKDLTVPAGAGTDIAVGLRYLASITGRTPRPTLRFVQEAAAALMAHDRRVDPAASTRSSVPTASRGGTSLAEVITAIVVNHRATPEQFATFLAVMARELGVPTRLATGFRLVPSPGAATLPAGTYVVTNREAWTWAEVPVAGVGWVVVDPTPTLTAAEAALPPASASATTPTTVPPRQATAVPTNVSGGGHALASPSRLPPSDHASPAAPIAAGVGGGIALLLALGPGLAAVRRIARRRSRRARDPAGLAAGAWLELLDALELAGLAPAPSATPCEVGAAVGPALGAELAGAVTALGELADRAVCSTTEPPDGPAAESAWAEAMSLRRRVLATVDRGRRLRALLRVGHQDRYPVRRARPGVGAGA